MQKILTVGQLGIHDTSCCGQRRKSILLAVFPLVIVTTDSSNNVKEDKWIMSALGNNSRKHVILVYLFKTTALRRERDG